MQSGRPTAASAAATLASKQPVASRTLQRHGISRLPDVDGAKPKRSRFKAYPIGYFHIDIARVSTEQGKLHLFVAIDR